MIYLDNNATTRVADEVIAAMEPYYRALYGNPHSSHTPGRKAHEGLEEAREKTAALIGAPPADVYFTSCGTEGNALAISGLDYEKRRNVVHLAVEHPSVTRLCEVYDQRGRFSTRVLPVGQGGEVDLEAAGKLIDDQTKLLIVMLAQNETGVIHPVAELAELAHARGALVLVDAVQATGKIPIDVNALGADLLTISGHKFHAPKGIGALYVRDGIELDPLWHGGGQERGLRSGTEPVAAAVGLGTASELAVSALEQAEQVGSMRDRLESLIVELCAGARINGGAMPRLPNTSSISFVGLDATEVTSALDQHGVYASAGAACHSGSSEPSAVMQAMGLPREHGLGTVRFSLSRFTSEDEIARAGTIIVDAIQSLTTSAKR
jgi:cysteine desulfurase